METLCAFLNGVGGRALFGVTNAGRIARKEDAINTGEIEWTGRILSCLFRGMPWERQWRTTMQTTLAVEDIKLTLPELLDSLAPGDEVILTRNHQPVAKLVSEKPPEREPRVPGLGRGMITIISDDEDHLKDFAEYMP
jgi:antitoxin (DNA-binding transcriptional repressor) of toxin-antitoxin stability system